jgi:hypothetical protein
MKVRVMLVSLKIISTHIRLISTLEKNSSMGILRKNLRTLKHAVLKKMTNRQKGGMNLLISGAVISKCCQMPTILSKKAHHPKMK